MTVYVVTAGYYSDYHIIGVTLDEEKAELLRKCCESSGCGDGVEIEEYDTDEFLFIQPDKIPYKIIFNRSGDIDRIKTVCPNDPIFSTYPDWDLSFRHPDGRLIIHLLAKDEASAIKIAAEKRAMYLAEQEGL